LADELALSGGATSLLADGSSLLLAEELAAEAARCCFISRLESSQRGGDGSAEAAEEADDCGDSCDDDDCALQWTTHSATSRAHERSFMAWSGGSDGERRGELRESRVGELRVSPRQRQRQRRR